MFMQRFNVFYASFAGVMFAISRPRTYEPFGDYTDLMCCTLPALLSLPQAALAVDGDLRNMAALMTVYMVTYLVTRECLTGPGMLASFMPTAMEVLS